MSLNDLNVEEMSLDDLLYEFENYQKKIIRLKELKAPDIIIEYEESKLNDIIMELSKYINMKDLDSLLQKSAEARKKEHAEWRKKVKEELAGDKN